MTFATVGRARRSTQSGPVDAAFGEPCGAAAAGRALRTPTQTRIAARIGAARGMVRTLAEAYPDIDHASPRSRPFERRASGLRSAGMRRRAIARTTKEGHMAAIREARAVWTGDLMKGSGEVTAASSARFD